MKSKQSNYQLPPAQQISPKMIMSIGLFKKFLKIDSKILTHLNDDLTAQSNQFDDDDDDDDGGGDGLDN